uniref:Peptidase S1 domain-containing protein n=1 Tax=Globisporangium ultimum (strain ATCC 200006 / CBS 805.95 / DAOM BR144) TaxID=431595 RepID=K3WIS4_GLOUD
MKFAATLLAAAVALIASTDAQLSYTEYLEKEALGAVNTNTSTFSPLILGGTVVPVGSNLYTSGLRQSATGQNICGGTLITPRHVLSAAHCSGFATHISVGSHFLSGSTDGQRIAVAREIIHPSYRSPNRNSNDFMIVELATPVTSIAPARLDAGTGAVVGATATVLGWGDTSDGGSPSRELRQVGVPIMSNTNCARVLSIDGTMLCAGGRANQDSCQGDSGGPLINSAGTLVGVVSWGNGCGLAGYPGVYSRVSTVVSWIQTNAPGATFV